MHLLRCSFSPDFGWKELAMGGVQEQIIPSAHEGIMEEPAVRLLADAFTRGLHKLELEQ